MTCLWNMTFFANFTRPLYRLLVIRKVRVVTYTGVWACKLFLCNIGNSVLQRLYNDRKRMLWKYMILKLKDVSSFTSLFIIKHYNNLEIVQHWLFWLFSVITKKYFRLYKETHLWIKYSNNKSLLLQHTQWVSMSAECKGKHWHRLFIFTCHVNMHT